MKYIAVVLMASLIVLSGCAPAASSSEPISSSLAQSEVQKSIEVDKNLLTVDITLPASMFEDFGGLDDLDLEKYKAENGFINAVKNNDGSLTVTMTKSQHKEVMSEMAESVKNKFSELVADKDTPYLKSIAHTDDFKKITVRVERAGYENAFFDITPFVIGFSVNMYQVFAGEEFKVEIVVCDDANGDEIETIIYPDDVTDKK